MIKSLFLIFYNKLKRHNTSINSLGVSHKARIGHFSEIMNGTAIDAFCEIGKYCYIGKYCNVTKSEIGNYCSIGNNVSIGQGEHDLTKISTSAVFYSNTYFELTQKDCIIGHDVWIGVDSIVLRGVKVGNGVVIGANSVVTKDVPDYAVVVGSPARIIKYRFDRLKIQKIEELCWWDLDLTDAKNAINNLEEL